MLDVKFANGKYKTLDDLRESAIRMIADCLDNMDDWQQLEIGNEYRDDLRYTNLYIMDDDGINDALEYLTPWDIINLEVDTGYSYFTYDGCDLVGTDDIWEDIDLDDLAAAILDGEIDPADDEIEDIINEYNEAVEFIENLNEDREAAREVLVNFVNCTADWRDLYSALETLVNNADIWDKSKVMEEV